MRIGLAISILVVVIVGSAAVGLFVVRDGAVTKTPVSRSAGSSTHEPLKFEFPKQTKWPVGVLMQPSRSVFRSNDKASYMHRIKFLAQTAGGLGLSEDQIDQLQDVFSSIYEARVNYEAAIARHGKLPDGETAIEIPTYREYGAQLREMALSMFRTILGDDLSGTVIERIGSEIDASNAYWGSVPQTMLVRYDATKKLYVITHTINPELLPVPGTFRQDIDRAFPPGSLGDYDAYGPLFPKIAP